MKTIRVAVLAAWCGAAVVCAGLLCSCATNRSRIEPWMKDGRQVGTMETTPRPWGSEIRFKDSAGRLLQTEKHNPDGRLLAGVCIIKLSYGDGGALAEEQHLNANERLTRNDEGYAARRWTYAFDSDHCRVVEESFFDTNLQPAPTAAGFAILRRTEDEQGRAKKIEFLDLARKPAPSTWLGVANVAQVHYAYLQGVTTVTCAAFLDSSGKVLDRKQLSGQTSGQWENSYTTYYYYYH